MPCLLSARVLQCIIGPHGTLEEERVWAMGLGSLKCLLGLVHHHNMTAPRNHVPVQKCIRHDCWSCITAPAVEVNGKLLKSGRVSGGSPLLKVIFTLNLDVVLWTTNFLFHGTALGFYSSGLPEVFHVLPPLNDSHHPSKSVSGFIAQMYQHSPLHMHVHVYPCEACLCT